MIETMTATFPAPDLKIENLNDWLVYRDWVIDQHGERAKITHAITTLVKFLQGEPTTKAGWKKLHAAARRVERSDLETSRCWLRPIASRAAYMGYVTKADQKLAPTLLALANENRKARTLDMSDVYRAVGEAVEDGWGCSAGDSVANRYQYPAWRTCCVAAMRADGSIRVAFGVGSAKGASSPITPIIEGFRRGDSARELEQASEWANQG